METTIDNQTILCNKEDITLVKHGINKYSLSLESKNENINFRNIINFKLYSIMGTVNNKNIESVELVKQISEDRALFLFLFKPLGSDFGIPKKYMYLETQAVVVSDNVIKYTSKSIIKDDLIKSKVRRYEVITCNDSTLTITLHNNSNIKIEYNFDIDIHEDLPLFAQNLIGFMMKKIFLNLKSFIEKIR